MKLYPKHIQYIIDTYLTQLSIRIRDELSSLPYHRFLQELRTGESLVDIFISADPTHGKILTDSE